MALWIEVSLVVLLVLANAVFAGSEMALVTLREGQLRRLERRGRAGRALGRLSRDPNQFLATVQIGITLAGFMASATAAVSLAEPLLEPLRFLGQAAEPVAVVLVTTVLTFVTLVVGELAPKRVAMQRAERWSLLSARPLAFLARVSRPVVWALGRSTDLVVRMAGADPDVRRQQVTKEEVRELVATQVLFTPQQRTIITGAIEVADRQLRQVVVPRRDVVAVRADEPASSALRALAASGHVRAPVTAPDLDNVVGVVYLRDLVDAQGSVSAHARPCSFLPETVGVLDALRHLQTERHHLAVVVSEHGVTEGIVTVEDLIEEVVGEVFTETDRDIRAVTRTADGSLLIPGSFPVHDLEDIGVSVPEGDYATVAGLVLTHLGRIPEPGDHIDVGGWQISIMEVVDRAIARVQLRPTAPATTPTDEGPPDL